MATTLPDMFGCDFRAVNLGGTVDGHLALTFENLKDELRITNAIKIANDNLAQSLNYSG
jgi:hypothetical protein